MDRFESKRTERLKLLRETGRQLFSEQGYEQTTIRQIAQQAKMALGLLYNYYGSKEELLQDIYRQWLQGWRQSLLEAADQLSANPVLAYTQLTLREVKQHRQWWILWYSLRLQSPVVKALDLELKELQDQIHQQVHQHFAQTGIPFPGLETSLYFASLDGLIQHYLLQDSFPIDDLANLLLMKFRPGTPGSPAK